MSEATGEAAQEPKRGGGVVFVAIFLGPFIAVAGVLLSRVLTSAPVWAPIAALAIAHWIVVTAFVRSLKKGSANMFVWSAAAALADLMWFGVLQSLVDAYG